MTSKALMIFAAVMLVLNLLGVAFVLLVGR